MLKADTVAQKDATRCERGKKEEHKHASSRIGERRTKKNKERSSHTETHTYIHTQSSSYGLFRRSERERDVTADRTK